MREESEVWEFFMKRRGTREGNRRKSSVEEWRHETVWGELAFNLPYRGPRERNVLSLCSVSEYGSWSGGPFIVSKRGGRSFPPNKKWGV